jgi:two-component system, OmpR family, heavy metal sensor histidine kinase CusS
MFWKHADGAAGTRWRSMFGGRSITAHVAWLCALSTIILLAIVVGLLYWVVLEDSLQKDFIATYRRASLLLVVVGSVLAACAGVLVARNGMRPMGDMAQVAKQISANRACRRVEPERWPHEVATLATALDDVLNRLDDVRSRQGRLTADLAHELRTFVHGLMGQTEIALSKECPAGEYRRILESNLEEYDRLARKLNGLLFLARADDPKNQIERSRHDARAELEAVREFHESLAEDRGVSVVCTGQADLYADPILFRRAVSNLLSNALRHTPKGGQIVLSAEQTEDHGTLVRVSDTGCGIADKDMPRLCERLHFPVQDIPRRADGTGLGLAIVKSIAELHSGTISVQSRQGQGTVVTLCFPNPAPGPA